MVKRFKFGMENEVQSTDPTDTTDPATTLTEGEAEITDLETELGQVSLEGDRLFMAHEALTELADVTKDITEPTETELALIQNNIENIARINDEGVEETMPEAQNVVSIESYGKGRGNLAIEEAAKSMWKRIIEWIKNMFNKVVEFSKKLLGINNVQSKACATKAVHLLESIKDKNKEDPTALKEAANKAIEYVTSSDKVEKETKISADEDLAPPTPICFSLSSLKSLDEVLSKDAVRGLVHTVGELGHFHTTVMDSVNGTHREILDIARRGRGSNLEELYNVDVQAQYAKELQASAKKLIAKEFTVEAEEDGRMVLASKTVPTYFVSANASPYEDDKMPNVFFKHTLDAETNKISSSVYKEWLTTALSSEANITRTLALIADLDNKETTVMLERFLTKADNMQKDFAALAAPLVSLDSNGGLTPELRKVVTSMINGPSTLIQNSLTVFQSVAKDLIVLRLFLSKKLLAVFSTLV